MARGLPAASGMPGADQRIRPLETLRIETTNNAYLTFEETIKDSIVRGDPADLVVLPGDLPTGPEKHIEQMRVAMTMLGRRIVYERR